jgi:hypothetical protein
MRGGLQRCAWVTNACPHVSRRGLRPLCRAHAPPPSPRLAWPRWNQRVGGRATSRCVRRVSQYCATMPPVFATNAACSPSVRLAGAPPPAAAPTPRHTCCGARGEPSAPLASLRPATAASTHRLPRHPLGVAPRPVHTLLAHTRQQRWVQCIKRHRSPAPVCVATLLFPSRDSLVQGSLAEVPPKQPAYLPTYLLPSRCRPARLPWHPSAAGALASRGGPPHRLLSRL